MAYTPTTGARCGCKRGVHRDNCPTCEGTGWVIDFAAIHAAKKHSRVERIERTPPDYDQTGPVIRYTVDTTKAGDVLPAIRAALTAAFPDTHVSVEHLAGVTSIEVLPDDMAKLERALKVASDTLRGLR